MVAPFVAPGETVRFVTVAVLALLLAALFAARLLRKNPAEADRKSIWQHIEELRRRLLVMIIALVAGTLFALSFRFTWMTLSGHRVPVPVPELYDNLAAQLFRAAAAHLKPAGVQLVTLNPLDGFMAQFDIALGIGIVAAMPVILYQLGRFFGPALGAQARRYLVRALVPTVALFLAGALFCYLFVLPVTLGALYQFSDALGATSQLQVSSLSSFALGFMLGFGIAFELPIAMYVLSRVGLVQPRTYLRYWRHATFAIVVVSAFLTPDPTIVSQLMMAIPMLGLYLGGTALAFLGARPGAVRL